MRLRPALAAPERGIRRALAAEAWRQELIQLLLLLAKRCERSLHPLPWALPVPPCACTVAPAATRSWRRLSAHQPCGWVVLDASVAPRNTREDALTNIREAISLWLEVEAEEAGVKSVETLELAV